MRPAARSGPTRCRPGIAACHARARTAGDTDWEQIVALYDGLAQLMPSPVVELNRAVAVGMAFGSQAALEIVDRLREEPALDSYHLLPSVRGDLLDKLGRPDEARAEFERAAQRTANSRQRAALLERAAAPVRPRVDGIRPGFRRAARISRSAAARLRCTDGGGKGDTARPAGVALRLAVDCDERGRGRPTSVVGG